MQNMNNIGNKYEITMFQWYEILAKAQKKLDESIECNRKFGDNEEWIIEDTEKLEKVQTEVKEIEDKIKAMNLPVDYERVKKLAFSTLSN